MKILFILEYYHPHIGGVETLFKSLIEILANDGNEITILTNQYDKSLPRLEESGNITIRRLPYKNRYLFTFLSIFPAIRLASNFDIIHTTSYNAAFPAFFASKFSGKKAIITFHEVWGKLWFRLPWMSYPSRILHYLFEKIILSMSFDKFVAVSDFTKNSLIKSGIPIDKVVRIYNGINYNEFEAIDSPPPFEKTTFLYFGRVGVSKGIDILIDAVALLKAERDDFQLIMVLPDKSDPLLKKVVNLIARKNLDYLIQIQKSIPYNELQLLIKKVDAVVIPSYSEGFCFAAVETMALGTPLITSGRGALNEVVGGQYLQIENLNSNDLKTKMADAINNNWKKKPMKRFTLENSVIAYLELYKKVLES